LKKINSIIAENLKKIRNERKLSLDMVSKYTGVSKSMLGQIERGVVNPTISTVWKIAYGLKISFTQLMSRPEVDIEMVDKSEIEPLFAGDGKFRTYPIFLFDEKRRFEIYSAEIDCGGKLAAEPHTQGSQEFITVFSGQVTITVDNDEYTITEGNSIRFNSDQSHTYVNSGTDMCKMSVIIYYP